MMVEMICFQHYGPDRVARAAVGLYHEKAGLFSKRSLATLRAHAPHLWVGRSVFYPLSCIVPTQKGAGYNIGPYYVTVAESEPITGSSRSPFATPFYFPFLFT
jgi:hypothetical protein